MLICGRLSPCTLCIRTIFVLTEFFKLEGNIFLLLLVMLSYTHTHHHYLLLCKAWCSLFGYNVAGSQTDWLQCLLENYVELETVDGKKLLLANAVFSRWRCLAFLCISKTLCMRRGISSCFWLCSHLGDCIWHPWNSPLTDHWWVIGFSGFLPAPFRQSCHLLKSSWPISVGRWSRFCQSYHILWETSVASSWTVRFNKYMFLFNYWYAVRIRDGMRPGIGSCFLSLKQTWRSQEKILLLAKFLGIICSWENEWWIA